MERQMTASVFIVEDDKVLLLFHKKLRKWLQPGGHMDPNETPPEAARREALEEVGIEIEFFKQENVWINRWNTNSFERPFLCMVEEIPAYKEHAAHQHIDYIYVARPAGDAAFTHNVEESDAVGWFTQEQVDAMIDDEEIYVETKELIRAVLSFCAAEAKR